VWDTVAFAVIVTSTEVDTGTVCTVVLSDVDPAGTFTDEASVAAELFLANVTQVPFDGAGPLRVTVTIELTPPVTACGATVTDASCAGTSTLAVLAVSTFPAMSTLQKLTLCEPGVLTVKGTV